jgi:chitosanase
MRSGHDIPNGQWLTELLPQFYGVWGDTNQEPTTGESSIALANLCFPNEHLTGDNGHGAKDVLYIGFTGDAAVPGKNGANWKAKNAQQFEDSIKALGDKLAAGLKA